MSERTRLECAGFELARWLKECSDDLESEVTTRYGGFTTVFTETDKLRIARDLHPVHEARAALAAWERAK